jgi:hypothetical protein
MKITKLSLDPGNGGPLLCAAAGCREYFDHPRSAATRLLGDPPGSAASMEYRGGLEDRQGWRDLDTG